ncbi:hypothetical protein K503DRAFT_870531 [Rhizopogon vinicolor AM-OR11-026]|uniref:Uncharacterized protein n=1 Tax=Rhizopogon vinicolor AM-OR11-026 TaxID=1314800 RepID=A0A1B7MGF8_9AGAM|nr:hypothetical protein K503DRAFT_870531 [Rhizopogon vinicolor AM-OR11-026]
MVRPRDYTELLHNSTAVIFLRELERCKHEAEDHKSRIATKWQRTATDALNQARSLAHYRDNTNVAIRESMDTADCFNPTTAEDDDEDDMPVIHPVVDGRKKDVNRTLKYTCWSHLPQTQYLNYEAISSVFLNRAGKGSFHFPVHQSQNLTAHPNPTSGGQRLDL